MTNAEHTPTSTEFEASNILEATAEHYKDSLVIWTTGDLAGQRTVVAAYAKTGTYGHFTVVGMTEAPADGDTFILV